jgi:hypothetical protein
VNTIALDVGQMEEGSWRASSSNHGLWFWTGAPCSRQRIPDFLLCLLALASFTLFF